jgi:hypothetical protein
MGRGQRHDLVGVEQRRRRRAVSRPSRRSRRSPRSLPPSPDQPCGARSPFVSALPPRPYRSLLSMRRRRSRHIHPSRRHPSSRGSSVGVICVSEGRNQSAWLGRLFVRHSWLKRGRPHHLSTSARRTHPVNSSQCTPLFVSPPGPLQRVVPVPLVNWNVVARLITTCRDHHSFIGAIASGLTSRQVAFSNRKMRSRSSGYVRVQIQAMRQRRRTIQTENDAQPPHCPGPRMFGLTLSDLSPRVAVRRPCFK